MDNYVEDFINNGFCIVPAENLSALAEIRNVVAVSLGFNAESNRCDEYLNGIHNIISVEDINRVRLSTIARINELKLNRVYASLAMRYLGEIVGNELAIQRNLNLSIQLPSDETSLLPMHADTWSGDSPYECVVWVPLVNCTGSKSMYILPQRADQTCRHEFGEEFSKMNAAEIYRKLENDFIFIDIKYGEVLIFNQNLPHGNIVNSSGETRISLNCRFKSLFSPYRDKKLREFFEPLNMKPMTKIGLGYTHHEFL